MTAVFVTALLLAVDAFFIGMSLGMQKEFKYKYAFIINAIVFLVCCTVFFIVGSVRDIIKFDTSLLVGIVFLALGLSKVLVNGSGNGKIFSNFKSIIVLGFVMSVDAMIGTVVLVIEKSQDFLIPVVIGAAHFIYTLTGSHFGKCLKISAGIGNVVSGLCLVLVGIFNIIGL